MLKPSSKPRLSMRGGSSRASSIQGQETDLFGYSLEILGMPARVICLNTKTTPSPLIDELMMCFTLIRNSSAMLGPARRGATFPLSRLDGDCRVCATAEPRGV